MSQSEKDEKRKRLEELSRCIDQSDVNAFAFLLEKSPDLLNERDSAGWNLLHNACAGGKFPIVRHLVEKGIDLHALSSEEGWTPAYFIIHFSQRLDVLVFLVNQGMDIDLQCEDEEGNSALHMAADLGSLKAVKTLIELGASPFLKNHLGQDAGEVARLAGSTENESYLKEVALAQTEFKEIEKVSLAAMSRVQPERELAEGDLGERSEVAPVMKTRAL